MKLLLGYCWGVKRRVAITEHVVHDVVSFLQQWLTTINYRRDILAACAQADMKKCHFGSSFSCWTWHIVP